MPDKLKEAMRKTEEVEAAEELAAIEETVRAVVEVAKEEWGPAEPIEVAFIDRSNPVDQVISTQERVCGDFSLDAGMSQRLKAMLRGGENWHRLNAVEREALERMCGKLARIMTGNPHYKEHWDGIAGYARLVAQRLP